MQVPETPKGDIEGAEHLKFCHLLLQSLVATRLYRRLVSCTLVLVGQTLCLLPQRFMAELELVMAMYLISKARIHD
jgi:hypothetical protein